MRFLQRLSGERGYTLVEMITVMLIMSVVMTGITTVFVQGSNAELDMNNRFQAQTNARLALDKLRKDLHCSSAVTPAQTGSAVSSVTLSDPCAAQSTVNTVGVLSGTGTGTFTIVSNFGFPTAATNYQIDAEIITGTVSGNTLTITARGVSGTTAIAHTAGTLVIISGPSVSWCAVTVSGNTGLYRQPGAACGSASPAIRQIDRLTKTGVFTVQAQVNNTDQNAKGGTLASLWVDLPVNAGTTKNVGRSDTYRLCDQIVLRNSTRGLTPWISAAGTTLTPPAGC